MSIKQLIYRSKSRTKSTGKVTRLKNFGFNNIPDVISLKEDYQEQVRQYSQLRRKVDKPKFVVSTMKRPRIPGIYC